MSSVLPESLGRVLEELDYSESNDLVTVASDAPGAHDYVWRELRGKVGLHATFFRDGVPLVGFAAIENPAGLADLRKRLWNYGRVPLLIAAKDDRSVGVYSATSNPLERASGYSMPLAEAKADRMAGLLRLFSRRHVLAGNFATEYLQHFNAARRVDQSLLSNLQHLRRTLRAPSPGRAAAMDILVGGSLIASYLEDRGVLDPSHLVDLAGVTTFNEALTGGRSHTTRLFEGLADRFNGDVFGAVPKALHLLTNLDLAEVAALLKGDDLPSGQISLWPYDFSVVPSDLVSSVYEQLLESTRRDDATYYTPRFLVDLVLDEVLPPAGEEMPTIVDLACGSGAFITEAFRRLAYRRGRGAGRPLEYEELTELLITLIYGVDINEAAARVTAFGLYLSLLEQVDPPTIWATAVLPQLVGRNVVVSDAFTDNALSGRKFDIVVGNPPWKSKITPETEAYLRRRNAVIGDQQLAQAFMWLAADALVPGGRLGLVMPAKAMLHNRSSTNVAFRRAVFGELRFSSIVDLSALRRSIFSTATAPSVVVVARIPNRPTAEASPCGEDDILHVAPRTRSLTAAVDAIVIAPEDLSTVSQRLAKQRPDIWKTLLWGSKRDLALIDRVSACFSNLQSVINARGWLKGQGYKVAPNLPQVDATPLRGFPVIEHDAVTPLRVDPLPTRRFDQPTLHRPREIELYRGPKILIARTLPKGRLAAALYSEDAVFSSNITAISGPPQDLALMAAVTATIVSSFGQYWHFMTSASWGVERDTVETGELLTTPIAIPDSVQERNFLRLLTRRKFSEALLQEVDEAVFDLFKLSEGDRLLIQDGLDGLAAFQAASRPPPSASTEQLLRYCRVVRERLTSGVPGLEVDIQHKSDRSFVIVAITFAQAGETLRNARGRSSIDSDRFLGELTSTSRTTAVVAQPAGLFLDDDTVFILKTRDTDRWSYSVALDDADRVFSALAFGA